MLKTRQMIPPLSARTLHPTVWGSGQAPAGRAVQAWDYKQKKNLVIAFLHAGCCRCEQFVARLGEHAPQLAEREAMALVIFSELPAATLAENFAGEIIVAADMRGCSQRAFLGEDAFGPAGQERIGVFLADRYGELCAQWAGPSEDSLPGPREMLRWLEQIEPD